MRRFAGGLFYLIGGAVAGAISAYVVIQNAGVAALGGEGPWLSRTEAQDGLAGIYVQSHYLLSGRLPAAPGQLVEATAERDSEGSSLSTSCTYAVSSTGVLPQWWSLSTLSSSGATPSRQSVTDATSAIRAADGGMQIMVAQSPQPGNWLKLAGGRQFTFLYLATPTNGKTPGQAPPFRIDRKGC